jgi:hypothetical protein
MLPISTCDNLITRRHLNKVETALALAFQKARLQSPVPQMPCLPPMNPRLIKALSLPLPPTLPVSHHRLSYPQSPLILPYFKHTVDLHLPNQACSILGRPHQLAFLRPSKTHARLERTRKRPSTNWPTVVDNREPPSVASERLQPPPSSQ